MQDVDTSLNPAKPAPSLARSRVGGLLIMLVSLVMGYFFIWIPLQHARTGASFSYSMKGVLITPAFFYMGCATLVTDLRDGQAFTIGPDGKKRATRKGWIFIGGFLVVIAVTITAWDLYLKSLGYSAL